MIALVLALGLAGGLEEDRLPRSLSEPYVEPAAASLEEGTSVWVGLHLGAARAVDGRDVGMVAGLEWRIHILPWLGMGGGIDVLSKEQIDNVIGGHFFQIPVTWSVLLYPPVDLGMFRPYALVGGGLTITDVSGLSVADLNLNSTDINLLYYVGLGVEVELGPNILLDAGVRYVWAHDPPGAIGYNADWRQFTVGVFVKLPN